MDPAVGLVQSYLRLNGFFTVTEFPIVKRSKGQTVTLTDADILAVRFPHAQRWIPHADDRGDVLPPDPALSIQNETLTMIIGEVKEGKAKFNRPAFSPKVIETIIRRFGCCSHNPADTAKSVLKKGFAETHVGKGWPCQIRMIVFAGSINKATPYEVISLKHVITFLTNHLRQFQEIFFNTQIKDDTLDIMALLVKSDINIQKEK